MKKIGILLLVSFLYTCNTDETTDITSATPTNDILYFPPINSNTWENIAPLDLDWDVSKLEALEAFLAENNTKSFLVLYKGRKAIEMYFDDHNSNSNWYWASAGKTLTTAAIGIAEQEGLLEVNQPVSNYLGDGWTNAPTEKEQLITSKHLLSMTSGLDDSLGNSTSPEDLHYVSDAGTRWAYHNVYVTLQEIISTTSGMSWSDYFNTKIKQRIGMQGNWISSGHFNIYWSTTESMARFGLLIAAGGSWDGEQILPETFLNAAINTSQNLNVSYGYLWWLNGKASYRLPQSQLEFTGPLIPNAPSDMYCALGKNDQKIYIIPSKDLVIVRMGQAANEENFALSNFDNALWEKINQVIN